MTLPYPLESALKSEQERCPQKALTEASNALTQLYRQPSPSIRLDSEALQTAYLTVRMPATFAVVSRVLHELQSDPSLSIKSLLDLGSGPGTVLWAAEQEIASLESAYFIEQSSAFIAVAKRLATHLPRPITCEWQQADINIVELARQYDLVTASYVVGELAEQSLQVFLEKAWHTAAQTLVIIEPGTPHGFQRILACREWLIAAGAHIAAPCPHQQRCPMQGTERWCHFSQRLPRSPLHRTTKGGSLGYEDEKYSYLIATKSAVETPKARVVGNPRKHSGHLTVDLCTAEGIVKRTFSRREGALYKTAQKLSWGDKI